MPLLHNGACGRQCRGDRYGSGSTLNTPAPFSPTHLYRVATRDPAVDSSTLQFDRHVRAVRVCTCDSVTQVLLSRACSFDSMSPNMSANGASRGQQEAAGVHFDLQDRAQSASGEVDNCNQQTVCTGNRQAGELPGLDDQEPA
ncbi:hypothetical protein C0Q70_21143 [Pomacea canaliculata]|uniref:Uncharacterized protein n=1 Tax=Pomacea canaliculata TaxID=400727 RepID=A0A2T7NBP7_POMCA|nr:hypothetical protein C0Q70_21143 [Pomacea canaliculata]